MFVVLCYISDYINFFTVLCLRIIPCNSSATQVFGAKVTCSAGGNVSQTALPSGKQGPDLHKCGA
jgi:hypothetical protein